MSGISVIDADGDVQEFAEATTWHVDDRGGLHLKADSKPVASFAKDGWQGVATSEASGPAFNAQIAHTAELRDINDALKIITAHIVDGTKFDIARFEALLEKRERAIDDLTKEAGE